MWAVQIFNASPVRVGRRGAEGWGRFASLWVLTAEKLGNETMDQALGRQGPNDRVFFVLEGLFRLSRFDPPSAKLLKLSMSTFEASCKPLPNTACTPHDLLDNFIF